MLDVGDKVVDVLLRQWLAFTLFDVVQAHLSGFNRSDRTRGATMSDHSRRGFIGSVVVAASLDGLTAVAGEKPGAPSATAQARLAVARAALQAVRADIGRGHFNPGERDPIWIWSRRRLEARLDISNTKAERVAAAQEHVDEMKGVEQLILRMYKAGQVDSLIKLDAEYRRLEAESWLERENRPEDD